MMKKLLLALLVVLFVLPIGALAEEYGWTDGEYHLENTGFLLRLPEGFTPALPENDEILRAEKGADYNSNEGYHRFRVSVFSIDDIDEIEDIDELLAKVYADGKQTLIDGIGEENTYEDIWTFLKNARTSPIIGYIGSTELAMKLYEETEYRKGSFYRQTFIQKNIPYIYIQTNITGSRPFYTINAYIDSSKPKVGWLIEDFLELPVQELTNQYYLISYSFAPSEEERQHNSIVKTMLSQFFAFENEDIIYAAVEEARPILDADREEFLEKVGQ